jgi:hypothetical protein
MTYQIGETEFVGDAEDGAHVGSIWTEKQANGRVDSFEVIWVLRKQSEGWRIAGMATPAEGTNEAMFLNFEDPDDLLNKLQATEEDLAGPEMQPQEGTLEGPAQPRNARVDQGGVPPR